MYNIMLVMVAALSAVSMWQSWTIKKQEKLLQESAHLLESANARLKVVADSSREALDRSDDTPVYEPSES